MQSAALEIPAGRAPSKCRGLAGAIVFLAGLYLIHLIPESESPPPLGAGKDAFQWQSDVYWQQLEAEFEQHRTSGCDSLAAAIQNRLAELDAKLDALALTNLPPEASEFEVLETRFLELAPQLAACPDRLPEYLNVFTRLRSLTKQQSIRWSLNSPSARARLYRALYGGRAAVEEVMLQSPPGKLPPLIAGEDEPSSTPAATVGGGDASQRRHSGITWRRGYVGVDRAGE